MASAGKDGGFESTSSLIIYGSASDPPVPTKAAVAIPENWSWPMYGAATSGLQIPPNSMPPPWTTGTAASRAVQSRGHGACGNQRSRSARNEGEATADNRRRQPSHLRLNRRG